MLTSLTIQNYALISQLEINFSEGFSVLTGETGAGKSIILGALSLILGQRADVKSIKQGENKCLIEGVFDISPYELEPFFQERDLEYDAKHCILRREIYSSGKSRAFINDMPVGLNDLRDLGSRLIDVHSQHQNLLLADDRFQMQVLDALAGNKEIRSQYGEAFRTYSGLLKKLHELKEAVARDASEQDYLQYQLKQLEEAKLKEGEQEELENEARTLSHVEEIKTGLFNIENTLLNDEHGAVLLLKDALNNMQKLSKLFSGADEMIGRLESAYLDIKDLSSEIASHQEKMEFDPDRLKFVGERLDLIYTLLQKHKLDSEVDLIQLRNELEEKLLMISNFDEQLEKLREETDLAMEKVRERAALLTHSRKKAAQKLEADLVEKVSVLGMPNMKFACELTLREHPDITGLDDVSFTFSANKNAPLKPVADIASGGEISRLMLGIKALVAGAMALPSIIFDEIDTGVSGEIADKMGNIMHDLGKVMQVITITHLPQIAAKGDTHYFVYKDEVNDVTETHIRMLSQKERIKEIAQMLSGSELTDAALENAKNLLKL